MPKTLNQILKDFQTIAENHNQIKYVKGTNNSFYFGDPWEFGANEKIDYPFMGVVLKDSNIQGKVVITNFTIFICDLAHKEQYEGNVPDALSDTQRIAWDIKARIKDIYYYLLDTEVDDSSPMTDFTDRFDDEVTGWTMDIGIRQFYFADACDAELVGSDMNSAFVNDQNGNLLYTLLPGQMLTVYNLTTVTEDYTVTGTTQSILHTPSIVYSVSMNGQKLTVTTDYTISGTTITFVTTKTSDLISITYAY